MWQNTKHTHLLTLDKEPMTDKSIDNTELQPDETRSFIGGSHSNMSEGLLKEWKWLRDGCIANPHTIVDGRS